MRWVWGICGIVSLALGFVGMALPLLPTVPLLLLATFCFARSSERLHNWLITHPVLGPPIEDWNRSGAINRRAKKIATLSIAVAFAIPLLMGVRPMILTIQAAVLCCVLVFIWTRPEA